MAFSLMLTASAATYWNQGGHQVDGTTKAIASVLMSDGTAQTMTIDKFW